MGLNLEEKKAVVAEVSAQVAAAQSIIVAEYRGLEVGNITVLRAQARKEGVYLRVLKNTLVRRAVAGTAFEVRTVAATGQIPAAKKKTKPGDPEIPRGPGAPRIQEFLYPTIGIGCMPESAKGPLGSAGGGNSLGRALVTAGPQKAPAPGPKRGQAGYVYTSLGTGPAITNHARPLVAQWLNLDTGRTGSINLKRNPKINATDGPGTFTAIATTGRGRVLSVISGAVTTRTKSKRIVSCGIVPVIGIAYI